MQGLSEFLASGTFVGLIKFIGVLTLIGSLVGITFVLHQMTRQSAGGGGERNWRFLFSCWADSVAIWILYASLNFTWLFERFLGILSSLTLEHAVPVVISSQYLVPVLELVIDALIMIIAIKLFLRIRRFVEQS